ncbi:Protein kinase-like domain [Penicillium roqueforti FM164]|uniref:Protein kinase-like domain n=1 Tax=Penicillium roqueforti (strain FM164) TaxID=1365484 RepID=W6Q4G7_PENRF|nr:Protein kinase-like domain [Penicillium roqueforti FM164]
MQNYGFSDQMGQEERFEGFKKGHYYPPNIGDILRQKYQAPEVMLKAEWSYRIDIWNDGVMAWDLFEGKDLFNGDDPDRKGYSTRAHLAEVIAILGPPPLTLIRRGTRSPEFFSEDDASLHKSEEFLSGRNKEMFLEFMKDMLQWKPEDRITAKELLQDPWLNGRSN